MIKTDVMVVRFIKDDFIIDIAEYNDEFEAWIHKKDMGIAEFMFSMPKNQSHGEITFDYFCVLVDANFDEYAEDYIEKYLEA